MTGRGEVVVSQQPDGWWRWRFVPSSPDGQELVSGEAYPDRQEAEESAAKAYPELHPRVVEPHERPHRLRALARRAAAGVLVVTVVVAAARSGRRSRARALT
jgi:hypothetical protein